VSYHLGKLRSANVVTYRRSSHDRRDVYYRLNLPYCQQLLSRAAHHLHPALDVPAEVGCVSADQIPTSSVLFLCTANSARSQMAEGLLRNASGGRVPVASAGTHPAPVHKHAIRAMEKRGIDIRSQRSSGLDAIDGVDFDFVVTVCDHLKEECPDYPATGRRLHWSTPDPVSEGEDAGKLSAFERVAEDLATRIAYLIPLLSERRSTR
jgi:protein-tyrosine-phosphatase